jgi:hypothetical protein
VVVPQHQLTTFLASAEDLEILGLSKKCANIHIGAADDLDEYDLGPLEALPSTRRNKRLKRKRAAAAQEAYHDEPEIKQESGSFDEVGTDKQTRFGSWSAFDWCPDSLHAQDILFWVCRISGR